MNPNAVATASVGFNIVEKVEQSTEKGVIEILSSNSKLGGLILHEDELR